MARKHKAHRKGPPGWALTAPHWTPPEDDPLGVDDGLACADSDEGIEFICMLLADGATFVGTNERGAPMFRTKDGHVLTISATPEDADFAAMGGPSTTFRL